MNEPTKKKINNKDRMASLSALLDVKIEEGIPSKQVTRQSLGVAIREQLALTPKGSHRKYPYTVVTPGYIHSLVHDINKENYSGKQEYVAMRVDDKEFTYVWRNL